MNTDRYEVTSKPLTAEREQTLQDVISRTEKRASDVLALAKEIKGKLYKSPGGESVPAIPGQAGMIGDVCYIEITLQDIQDVLAVVSERLA